MFDKKNMLVSFVVFKILLQWIFELEVTRIKICASGFRLEMEIGCSRLRNLWKMFKSKYGFPNLVFLSKCVFP